VVIGGWGAIGAPAGLPDSVTTKLTEAVKAAAESQEFIDVINTSGNLPLYTSPEDFATFYDDESARFEQLFAE